MLTFMLTCITCTSDVTSLGWEGGDVNVHVNLRHMHIVRFVTGVWGVGMLTFMLTCITCTSYVTSLGWGGGDVNVHANLRHMHIWRYVAGLGGMLTFMLTCVTAMWRLAKSAMPCSLSTRSNGHVNPKLMRSIRVWQWRWMNSKTKSLLELTGRALKNRMAM